MKMMRERYRGIRLEVGYAQFPKQTYTVSINLVEDMKNLIYRSEKIDVTFDTNYNPDCLYQIIV
jgi:RNase P/RNase MRP subunit p30